MTSRIGMPIAMLVAAGAIGLTGPASAAPSPARDTSVECTDACITLWAPVKCLMSDGTSRTFGNRCEAERYAACANLMIVGCMPV